MIFIIEIISVYRSLKRCLSLRCPLFKYEHNIDFRQHEKKSTRGVIKFRKSKKDGQYNGKIKGTKGQTTIYKTLQRKLNIEKHEPLKHTGD